MTPLARRVLTDMTQPLRKRRMIDPDGMCAHLREEFHCFEVTAINRPAFDVTMDMLSAKFPSVEWSFLPAPRTWIEYREQRADTWELSGQQMAFLLVERSDGFADVYMTMEDAPDSDRLAAHRVGCIALYPALQQLAPTLLSMEDRRTAFDSSYTDLSPSPLEMALFPEAKLRKPDGESIMVQWFWWLYGYLLLINTPNVVNYSRHQPHRGLARDTKLSGIFPLQAWTEITLHAGITIDQVDAGSETGQTKPWHWTRAHRRRIDGVWTLIRDYWSGDIETGFRRSRYKVVP